MNFDLGDLRAFLAASDLGSFRSAAKVLHLSESALSRRIDKLEDALGVELLTRTTRKIELTTIGRTFVHRARNVILELESALIGIKDVAEQLSGEVTLACVPSAVGYFLPSVLDEYRKLYPKIRVRVLDESSSNVLLAVTRGDADFGVTYIGTQEADIHFQPLIEEAFVLACPTSHPLSKHKKVTWKDIGQHGYIALAQGSGNRFLIDQALAQSEERPRWFYEVNHVPALVSLVLSGLGVGVVPRMALPPDGHQGLVAIPITNPVVSRKLGLISRRGRQLPVAAQVLYDMLITKKTTARKKSKSTQK
ncbi:LysR family transcriptional regulator [Polynucleobacter sinensis]|uniref:LysR family transcriptional regulator n=1 Tax=Polynucleobacter sinensis TaxID=1743157 RepID=UPI000780D727|nr:LysR family transcriptional regulator [Polynucleobacter sinensis]